MLDHDVIDTTEPALAKGPTYDLDQYRSIALQALECTQARLALMILHLRHPDYGTIQERLQNRDRLMEDFQLGLSALQAMDHSVPCQGNA
jgi:hypothetical protein